MEPDALDRAILAELRRDGRASMSDIAARVNTSRANAYARVKRLTDSGVIRGFTVRTDAVQEGLHSTAYVSMQVAQADWQDLRTRLAGIPEVRHASLIGGDFDVLLLVRARDNRDLRRVVLEELQAIPSVRSTRTFLVYEELETIE
ncbi:winged helix-turn-helix transcriptional regulator [Agromyces sp. CFH 90414]|uniref:Winged helix-turn-helix transcriptional regulator n=1 Tax=Agromyces agglutinans TaxID=2662258 RepID=A0A6I2FA86_9MICO|nr:Lrp/AsnC family transcriptional regulator [Agromyces agglutinans]MRG59306.1 winged helix-turn-helix transcriptional regulator [Agromyces agglutinans]